MTKDVRWTPRLSSDGQTFCSPACGFKCTTRKFNTATERAQLLADTLGPGWVPKVWENMGWHYSAEKGLAQVHANLNHADNSVRSYTLYLNSSPQIVVSTNDLDTGLDAVALVAEGLKRLDAVVEHLREVRAAVVAGNGS